MIDILHVHAAVDALTALAGPLIGNAPDPGSGEAPPGSENLTQILRWGMWIFTAAAVAGGLFIAGNMVIAHRRGDDVALGKLGYWLAGCVLAGVAPQIVDALI